MKPLNVLLSHAVLELTREVERAGIEPNVVQWSNFVRVIDDDGVDAKQLHTLTRTSRRVAKSLLGRFRTRGLVTVDAGSGMVRPTAQLQWWRDEGAAIVAAAEIGELRAPVAAVVSRLALELPHYPVPYGPSDGSITGGPGVDWKPVRRGEGDTTSGLPLLALLSQAFLAFAIEYEAAGRGPLLAGVHLRAIPDGGIPLEDAPVELQIDGSGRSGFERHGVVKVTKGVVRLTAVGQIMRDSYAPLVREVEESWREQFGGATVDALRSALEAADATFTTQHAETPWVRHVVSSGLTEASEARAASS